MVPQFCDVSQFQPQNLDWQAYKAWSAQGDGISRVAIRSSHGNGYTDVHFRTYRDGALAAGIDQILFYHYSYPQINNAIDEAKSQHSIVGAVRPQDLLILDFEENVPQATADWAYAWLAQQEDSYDGKLPGIYASTAYIAQRLNDPRLAKYKLWLANWEFTPDERPPVPAPWQAYEFVQYTDNATNVPGIASAVDCNIFLGQENKPMTQVPQGWTDDGTTLTAPNKIPVVLGFRDHVLNNNWDPANWPLEPETHYSPVEQSHPSLGGGQAQTFRWKRIEYTAAGGIVEGWLGQELLWYQQQHALLQAQITDLQAQVNQLKNLPIVTNLEQITTIGQRIRNDVDLVVKLATVN
jgi:Glycosyl hydrolases family 25